MCVTCGQEGGTPEGDTATEGGGAGAGGGAVGGAPRRKEGTDRPLELGDLEKISNKKSW